ncbi:hypothetical protein LT493_32845 [Streptomyces tricolor]|nr:hypothetical protein [Streptomyces tricolor]
MRVTAAGVLARRWRRDRHGGYGLGGHPGPGLHQPRLLRPRRLVGRLRPLRPRQLLQHRLLPRLRPRRRRRGGRRELNADRGPHR